MTRLPRTWSVIKSSPSRTERRPKQSREKAVQSFAWCHILTLCNARPQAITRTRHQPAELLFHFSPIHPRPCHQTTLLLRLDGLPTLSDSLEDLFSVLVELQLGDDDLRRVHAEGHGLAVGLLPRHALDVDQVFQTVDGHYFSLAAFVAASHNGDFVVFADGDGADLDVYKNMLESEFPFPLCPLALASLFSVTGKNRSNFRGRRCFWED